MTLTIPFDGKIEAESNQNISDAIMKLSGIESVVVNVNKKMATVTGGDLDYLTVCDVIEELGFTVIR